MADSRTLSADPAAYRRSVGSSARPAAESIGGDAPRERLASRGAAALSDAELIALVVRTGARGFDSLELAQRLLQEFGGLRRVAALSQRSLARADGVGPVKAAALRAAFELACRLEAEPLVQGRPIRSPEAVDRHFRPHLRGDRQESFRVVLLDGRHRYLGDSVVTRGTLTASLVHPREVFRPALLEAAAALLLVHNHPSGDPSPSAEDREVTRRLVGAGELMGVRVLDHVIIAERGYFSFREAGELEEPIASAAFEAQPVRRSAPAAASVRAGGRASSLKSAGR